MTLKPCEIKEFTGVMRGIAPIFVIILLFAQTMCMKWILFGCVLGVVFVIFLLFFPFLISIAIGVDANEKQAKYCIKFCGIKIIVGKAVLDGFKIKYINERAWFVGNKKMNEIVPLFAYILFTALDVLSLDIKIGIGNRDNPALSACGIGFALSFLGCLYAYFITKNPKGSFKKEVVFLQKDNIRLHVRSFIGVSFFNVIKSLIVARIEQGKSVQTKAEVKK